MKGKKSIRERGKVKLSKMFQELKIGDKVALVKDPGFSANFPSRIQGNTGIIESKRGKAYIIKLKDFNEEKRYIVEPIHLKKIKSI